MAELVVTNLTETETETARRRFTGAGDSAEVGFFMTNPSSLSTTMRRTSIAIIRRYRIQRVSRIVAFHETRLCVRRNRPKQIADVPVLFPLWLL